MTAKENRRKDKRPGENGFSIPCSPGASPKVAVAKKTTRYLGRIWMVISLDVVFPFLSVSRKLRV